MIRSSTAFASLAALALAAGAAQAQAPRDGAAAALLDGNVVGGGVLSQSGRIARFASGQGEGGPRVEYLTPAPTSEPGREAWLLGGGDNAEVVYVRPR